MQAGPNNVEIESYYDNTLNNTQQYFLEHYSEETNENDEIVPQVFVEDKSAIDEEDGVYFVDNRGNYYYQPKVEKAETVIVDDLSQEMNGTVNPLSDNYNHNQSDKPFRSLVSGDELTTYVIVLPSSEKSATEKKPEEIENSNNEKNINLFQSGEDFNDLIHCEEQLVTQIDPDIPDKAVALYKCHICSYGTCKHYLLTRHMKTHSSDRPYKCSICHRGFKSQPSLDNHFRTHTGFKPHACKYCSSTFATSGELTRHARYRHTLEKPHKCTECDYASVELSKLKRHFRCHTGERPYQCPHCTYASPDTFKLKRHLRTHSGEKPYVCDLCNASFTQSNSLKSHRLIHTVGGAPVFSCQLCPTKCSRKVDLRSHIQRMHTSDKPYLCKRCCRFFPDRYSLKLHGKTHIGEKCFKCDTCSYASTSERLLISHMFRHTNEKPFECSKCTHSFRQKQLLRRHDNLYHNPTYVRPPPKEKIHQCQLCNRSFANKGNLLRHISNHNAESSIHIEIIDIEPHWSETQLFHS